MDKLKRFINEEINKILNEGIDIDEYNLTVSYNPSHEENVETSETTNPTVIIDKYVPHVEVWSIFKRKVGCHNDGNPLVYALKGENGWSFASEKDKNEIYNQIEKIVRKFFETHNYPVTIMLPTRGPLNRLLLNLVNKYNYNARTIDDLLIKLEVGEVREMLLAEKSRFREIYNTEKQFRAALRRFDEYAKSMTDGIFRTHLIKNQKLRSTIEYTFKVIDEDVYKYIEAINDKNILLLDDNIGHGSSIQNACDEILAFYDPNDITVLTLFSEKYDI